MKRRWAQRRARSLLRSACLARAMTRLLTWHHCARAPPSAPVALRVRSPVSESAAQPNAAPNCPPRSPAAPLLRAMHAPSPLARLAPAARVRARASSRRCGAASAAHDPSAAASPAGVAPPSPWAQGVAEVRRRRVASAPPPPAREADPVDAVLSAFGVANKATRVALQRRRGVFLHADLLARRLAHLQARAAALIHAHRRRAR